MMTNTQFEVYRNACKEKLVRRNFAIFNGSFAQIWRPEQPGGNADDDGNRGDSAVLLFIDKKRSKIGQIVESCIHESSVGHGDGSVKRA